MRPIYRLTNRLRTSRRTFVANHFQIIAIIAGRKLIDRLLQIIAANEFHSQCDFFETRIRPVLAKNCFACHSGSKMGGLQLDSREHALKGGNSGAAIVPGHADQSLLVEAITQRHEKFKMPPGGKLKTDDIEAIQTWINAGAVWPEGSGKPVVQHDWQAEQAAAPKKKRHWPRIVGCVALASIVCLIGYLYWMINVYKPIRVLLAGAGYESNLAVEHNARSQESLVKLKEQLKSSSVSSSWRDSGEIQVDGPRRLGDRTEWDELKEELLRFKGGTLVLVLALHVVRSRAPAES